jgi:hypothetical protein
MEMVLASVKYVEFVVNLTDYIRGIVGDVPTNVRGRVSILTVTKLVGV